MLIQSLPAAVDKRVIRMYEHKSPTYVVNLSGIGLWLAVADVIKIVKFVVFQW